MGVFLLVAVAVIVVRAQIHPAPRTTIQIGTSVNSESLTVPDAGTSFVAGAELQAVVRFPISQSTHNDEFLVLSDASGKTVYDKTWLDMSPASGMTFSLHSQTWPPGRYAVRFIRDATLTASLTLTLR